GGVGGGAGGPGAFGGRPPNPSLFIVDADRNPPQPNTGRVNYTLRMYLDPKEEFKQIFNEMWRNERDYLYVPNMHGTDWKKDKENWNPELRSPLAVPGVNVSLGDYILAINGTELKAPDNINRLLDGTANRQTSLTVNDKPSMDGARHVVVVPVANEQGLRTRAWVESNRRLVEKLSDGQLAYVYLPNTGQPGYTSFNRYYFAQQDKQGAIVDERYNGGGSAADYIIDVLQRDFDGYFNNVA